MPRVGVVGVGNMGQHHARIYSACGARLAGVSDMDPVKGNEIAARYGVRYFPDYHELIGQVDAVSVVVPTSLHCQVAVEFLRAGIHVLVEKPIAPSVDEAQSMIWEAERSGAKLMVGHIERFNPAVTLLKELLDQGSLGQLMIISTRRVGPFVPRIRDVGIIIDSATHDIDVARYLVGKEPVDVYSRTGMFKHVREDHGVMVLDFGGVTASIEVNWFTPHKVRTLVATGSDGTANLDYIEQSLVLHNGAGPKVMHPERGEPLALEIQHFLSCVRTDAVPLVSGREGLRTLQVALQAERSTVHAQRS